MNIVPGTAAHALQLARTMRADDVRELEALGVTPEQALAQSLATSDASFAFLVGDQVGAMFGVGLLEGVSERIGHAWILSGEPVTRHPLAFFKASKLAVASMLELYPCLFNIVDARYEASVRWLTRLKFELGPPQPFGPLGVLFHPARLTRAAWAR